MEEELGRLTYLSEAKRCSQLSSVHSLGMVLEAGEIKDSFSPRASFATLKQAPCGVHLHPHLLWRRP